MPIDDVLPELALLGGGVVALLYALFAPRSRQSDGAWIALAALAAAAVLTAPKLAELPHLTFGTTWAVDGGALWGKLVVLVVAALAVLLSVDWLRGDPRHGEWYTLLLFSTLGAVILAAAADLMEVVLGVLLSSATGYVLAGYHRRSGRAGEAAIKYYLLGALANGGLVYGVVLLFGLVGTTTLGGLGSGLPGADPLVLAAGTALVAGGLAFKMGAVPAHAWMPDVADAAPAPAAAFLTAAPKVGALLALGRLALLLPEDGVGWRPLVALLAAATMTLGNLAALWQEDLRRLLGWSAVSQSGYALMGVVALGRSDLALPALLYFLAAYAVANLAAFGVVAALRGLREVSAYAGLFRTRPGLTAALAIAFLSFVGIPPLAGFAGKLALFAATLEAGYLWLAALAAANTVVSLFYYLRVVGPACFGTPGTPEREPAVAGWRPLFAVGLASVAVVGLGVAAELAFGAFASARLLPG